jgi:hypothetical protein
VGRTQGEHEVKPTDRTQERYAEHEIGKLDRFFRVWVGRLHPNASEVVSMGLQAMSNPEDGLTVHTYDPEHLALTPRIGSGSFAVP